MDRSELRSSSLSSSPSRLRGAGLLLLVAWLWPTLGPILSPTAASADGGPLLAEVDTAEGILSVLLEVADDGSESLGLYRRPSDRQVSGLDAPEAIERLPSPKLVYDRFLTSATLVTDDAGRLEHMLWVEGTERRETRVRAAQWTGLDWAEPVTVEGFGAGSRTGVVAVRRGNGDLLAAWSAFDGHDDEIHWSRHDGDGWSEPRALTVDGLPDVTPALGTDGDAAFLAWSSYDGADYRLEFARWTGEEFAEVPVASGRGTARPRFQRTPDGALVLTWRQAEPRGWGLALLSAEGRLQRSAIRPIEPPGDAAERPIVTAVGAEGLVLADGPVLGWVADER